MDHPVAPGFPVLDKAYLFVPVTIKKKQNRYLQCPATGDLYCLSTGSLFQEKKPITPLSAKMSSLNRRGDSCLIPSIPTPSTNNVEQLDSGASVALRNHSNMSPNVTNFNQPIQGNNALITNADQHMPSNKGASAILNTQKIKTLTKVRHEDQPFQGKSASVTPNTAYKVKDNQAPNVNNADESVQGKGASSISKTTSKIKNLSRPIQDKSPPIISSVQSNKNSNVKKVDQPLQGISASIPPSTNMKKASKNKSDTSTQANSAVQSANNSSLHHQSNSNPTTHKEMKKCSRKSKNSCNSCIRHSKKKSASNKQNKYTLPHQSKPNTSFIKNTSKVNNLVPITQVTKPCEAKIYSSRKKRKSYTYYKFYLHNMIKVIQPIQINFEHLLFPQDASLSLDHTKISRNHADKNTEIIQVSSLSDSKSKCPPICTNKEKPPSLYFDREDYENYLENNFKKKTAKKINCGPVSQRFKTLWEILRPFNRRPHSYHDRHKSLWSGQCKNCIMASSVHEIVHSRFAKNTNEQMPVSQIRAMLSSGDRKLRTRQEWIQRMEEEAIHKYKKINLEKHKQRLEVQEYDVLHHNEKYWLACSSRSVINRKNKESWPLLVKCLYKYPDSTLRQASTHRSFCLSWNGTSYTLRMDHAYYTQIQCLMAIMNTLYAELIVHTHKETTILPVYFDNDFWKHTEATLETFYTRNILPYLEKTESNPANPPLDSENSNEMLVE